MKCRKIKKRKWVYKSRNLGMGPTSQSTPQNYCPQLRWMKMKAQCRRKSSEGKPGRRAKRLMSSFARSGLPILVPAGQVWCRINSRTALRRPIRCRVPDYPQGVRDKGGWFKSGTEVKTGRSSGVLKCSERRSQWVFNSLFGGKVELRMARLSTKREYTHQIHSLYHSLSMLSNQSNYGHIYINWCFE